MSAPPSTDEGDMTPDHEPSPPPVTPGDDVQRQPVRPDDIVGAAAIASRLGYSHPESIHTLRRRDASFPPPIARLKRALLWRWPDVQAWARSTGRAER
jgi:hypothetical protein